MNSPTTPKFPLAPIRRVTSNLDHLRVPLNALERAERPGSIPYWGANSVVDHVDTPIVDGKIILIGEDGAPFLDKDRPVAFSLNEPIWPNNHVHVLRATGGNDHRFISFALNAVDYRLYIKGSTRDKLNQADLSSINIPLPAPSVQRRIADYLDHETAEIDAFIADLEFMQSLVLERGEAERDKMIWDANQRLIPLRRLISYVDQGSSPQATSTPAGPGEVGILKSGCTNFGQFNPNANKAIPEGMEIPENYFVEEGDLIVSRASGSTKHVASTAVVPALDRLLALSDKHYRLHMNYGVDVHYIATVMQSMPFRNQLEPYISGASGLAKNISLSALKSMTVPALPAADQSHIGNKARESFLKIRETTQSIATAVDLARERRAAFITAAVTGQIDVTAKNKPAAEQLEDDIAQGLHKES